ncbi:DUF998 domain-containing protein [Shewanella fidelis]|uniref:DUF998 domain-containing protein n=1 Tax=Shewanella fidelis TaxID=173509 RepID=UPI00048FF63B|nr:DUF998 domain-containing protein [Shewanella fidelis]
MFTSLASYSGLIATIWIIVGVYIAGRYYPGYRHAKQFCSELGASGSPTEKLSPIINNYPLGLLFSLFGWYLIELANVDVLVRSCGGFIILHGVTTWIAGYFPMDADPFTKSPSFSCKVHSWAGFIMLLALLIAPILIVFAPTSASTPLYFRIFSAISVIVAIYYLFTMARAVKQQTNPGVYQRLSYGVQLAWLSLFSLIVGV